MSAVDIAFNAAVEERAKELYAVARTAFYYAPSDTPDGRLFDQSEKGRLLMNAMRKVAAHIADRLCP